MKDRFSKALVLQTIEQMRRATESWELWDEFPGTRVGRRASFDWRRRSWKESGRACREPISEQTCGAPLPTCAPNTRSTPATAARRPGGGNRRMCRLTGNTLRSLISLRISIFEDAPKHRLTKGTKMTAIKLDLSREALEVRNQTARSAALSFRVRQECQRIWDVSNQLSDLSWRHESISEIDQH